MCLIEDYLCHSSNRLHTSSTELDSLFDLVYIVSQYKPKNSILSVSVIYNL